MPRKKMIALIAESFVKVSAQNKFKMNETVTGNDSGASAVINNYKPNPVNKYRLYCFLNWFRCSR